jgi:hypothetical protein
MVFQSLSNLLRVRASQPAFNPHGKQRALQVDERVFALLRTAEGQSQAVLCLVNVTPQSVSVRLSESDLPFDFGSSMVDLISGARISSGNTRSIELMPYQASWLGQP